MISDGKPQFCSSEPSPIYRPDRRTKTVYITNVGFAEARLGSYKVQIDTGIPLGPGVALVLESDAELSQEWYAISEHGTEISVTILTT